MSDRNDILKTDGKLVLDAGVGGTPTTFYSKTLSCKLQETLVTLTNARHGDYDQVVTGRLVRIELTPMQFTAPAIAKAFCHMSIAGRFGGSIIGATDKKAYVATVDGQRREMDCAFVFQEPAMTFDTGKTIMGQMVVYGIVGLNGNTATLDTFWKNTSAAWSDTDWDPDHCITPAWKLSWKKNTDSRWDEILVREGGVTVTPESKLSTDISQRGFTNATLSDYQVKAAAKVMSIKEADVLEAAGFSLPLGSRKSSLGRKLRLQSTTNDAFVHINGAVLQSDYAFGYDVENAVVADLNWVSYPSFTAGVRDPKLIVSLTDPEAEEG